MDIQKLCRWFRGPLAGALLLANAASLSADCVKLNGGGSLSGSVSTGSKTVAVRTSTGGLMVFDRTAIKQVTHGKNSLNKAASTVGAKSQAKRRKFTTEEEAWMPKVRALASRTFGSDRAKSQRALKSLLEIDDTDALPALSTYLGSSRTAGGRQLYVATLHNMKGPKPVYYLVALSLYDPLPEIRAEARKAIREDEFDSARLLYIAALRSGVPALARLSAVGLGEIGDPRGDSVPYLIDALVGYGTVASMRMAPQYEVLFGNAIYSTPGLKISDTSAASTSPGGNASLSPSSSTGASNNQNPQLPQNPTGTAQQSPQAGTGTATAQGSASSSYGNCQTSGSSNFAMPLTEADLYDPPHKKCAKHHDKPLTGYVDHPEVLDALLKITNQPYPGYGFNQDKWRSWWANETANRALQKSATTDRVVAADRASK